MDPLRHALGLPQDAPFERVRHKWRLLHVALGLELGATPPQIRSAWRRFLLRHHPDHNPDDEGAAARFRTGDAAQALLLREDLRILFAKRPPPALPGRSLEHRISLDLLHALHGGQLQILLEVPELGHRQVTVTLPRGTDIGLRLTAAGEGYPGDPPGDLVLVVDELTHDTWAVDEAERWNLTGKVRPTLSQIYEGRQLPVSSPWGEIEVKLRAGSLRPHKIKGYGVRRGNRAGDLILELDPVLPPTGDAELAKVLRRLQG